MPPSSRTSAPRRAANRTTIGVLAAVAVLGTSLLSTQVRNEPADAAPVPVQSVVSGDSLPTVQINGVVWSQAVVGNTVYVGGRFTSARPAGSALGQNETARSNFLAYDLTTGQLDTTFAPSFNAQIRAVAASPDGTRLYVAGDFTTVNGLARDRIAAFDLRTRQLIGTFLPPVAYNAHALAVTDTTVYVGGNFNAVGSTPRGQLAALRASDGALLDWAPQATGGLVQSMVLSPDRTRIVVGGKFEKVNGSTNPGRGLAMLDATTGALLPLPLNSTVRNSGDFSGIVSLATDGTYFYGTGIVSKAWRGNLEGTFAARWSDGGLHWIADCHGDHYSAHPMGDVVYTASHAHYCGNYGGIPEQGKLGYHYAQALTRDVRGTLAKDPHGYPSFEGQPAPAPVPWMPAFGPGTATGTNNGPWHITGNDRYLVVAGEFLTVDHRPQQGLARFAVRSNAPNKMVPRLFLDGWTPRVTSLSSGTVHVHWGENWDYDDDTFTYRVERKGTWPAIHTTTGRSFWWDRAALGYTDRGLPPGSTQEYRVVAVDPWGNEAPSKWVSVTVANSGVATYPLTVLDDHPTAYWRLGEATGTATDLAGAEHLTVTGTVTRAAAGAISGDTDAAITFDNGTATSPTQGFGPQTFTVEAWFRTSLAGAGKIVGFGNARTGASSRPDRHLYVGTDGKLHFGIRRTDPCTEQANQVEPACNAGRAPGFPAGTVLTVVSSTAAVNDDRWHHAVGTLGDGMMRLYIDGVLVAERPASLAENPAGWWRVGGDSLSGWPSAPTGTRFRGAIDEVAVYGHVLGATAVERHFRTGSTGQPPTTTTTTTTSTTTTTTTVAPTTTTTTTPPPPPPPPPAGTFVTDTFTRAATTGWGTPDAGTPWAITGPPDRFGVDGSTGRITLDQRGLGVSAYTDGAPAGSTATDLRVTVGVDKPAVGGSIFVSIAGRHVGAHDYRAKLRIQPNGSVQAVLNRVVGTETVLADTIVAGLTVDGPGTFEVRLRVTGTNPTTIELKVWPTGTPEPATWTVTATDSTPELQAPGGIGITAYLSTTAANPPVTITIDNLTATRI